MQVQSKQVKTYTLTFTEEEMELFYHGIGTTSLASRERAGMTQEQSVFFSNLWDHLYDEAIADDQ